MTGTGKRQDIRYRFLCRSFICYVTLAGGLSIWAWRNISLSALEKLALMGAGLLVWTLIEYLLHRFLLHYDPQAPALLAVAETLHLGHHRDPWDEAKITVPVFASLPVAGGLLALFRLLSGSGGMAALLLVGSITGYLYYEWVHFRIHLGPRRGRWLRQQRANHLLHHFKDQHRCFGVTTSLWDRLLGTYRVKA